MVNTPHNPTGKVFSRQELEAIADVVRENPRVRVDYIRNSIDVMEWGRERCFVIHRQRC